MVAQIESVHFVRRLLIAAKWFVGCRPQMFPMDSNVTRCMQMPGKYHIGFKFVYCLVSKASRIAQEWQVTQEDADVAIGTVFTVFDIQTGIVQGPFQGNFIDVVDGYIVVYDPRWFFAEILTKSANLRRFELFAIVTPNVVITGYVNYLESNFNDQYSIDDCPTFFKMLSPRTSVS